MTSKPETRVQQRIRKSLEKEVGGYWLKIHGGPFQKKGVPDLLGCVKGIFFGFEVKRPGYSGSATPLQEKNIKDIKDSGGVAAVVETPKEAIRIVKRVIKNHTIYVSK